jgi:hypothetical protein
MRWARYRGWRLEEKHEERNRVRLRALQFALSFGADAEVIEPAALRNRVPEAARDTIERYTSLGQPDRPAPDVPPPR